MSKRYQHKCPTLISPIMEEVPNYNGQSVEDISVDSSGQWIATQYHNEYGTIIKFCPFCGRELSKQYNEWKMAGLWEK